MRFWDSEKIRKESLSDRVYEKQEGGRHIEKGKVHGRGRKGRGFLLLNVNGTVTECVFLLNFKGRVKECLLLPSVEGRIGFGFLGGLWESSILIAKHCCRFFWALPSQ